MISALVLGIAGAAGSQLFAALHDDLTAQAGADGEGVVAIVRMALTAGWVVGPVLGSYLAAAAGFRAMLVTTGICTLAQILPLGALRSRTTTPAAPTVESAEAEAAHLPRGHRLRILLPLLTFTGLYVLVYAGEPIKYAYLPIYMRQLHFPAVISGAIIGIQPLIELLLMPLSVLVARRTGIMRLMVLGAAFGVGANLCFALTGSIAGMFAGQILMGGVWGVFAALGIIAAQRLLSQAVATASVVFLSSTAIASALGGLTGAIGVSVLGLPLLYLGPAAFGLIAAAGLVLMSRSRHDVH